MMLLSRVGLAFFVVAATACAPAGPKFPPITFNSSTALGAKTAPVVVMEFSDFHCPFCRRHATTVFPRLKREYVETGKVLYVFRHFPLDIHPEAPGAGAAAACAARQGRFWEMHDRLFAAPGRPTSTDATTQANDAGLDLPSFRTCMASDGPADVRADTALGNQLGISGTPAFIFGLNNGGTSVAPVTSISGADVFESFAREIDRLIKN